MQKMQDSQFYGKENNTMAEWAKEIMTEVENVTVPQGKNESNYKYDRAWSRLKPMLLR